MASRAHQYLPILSLITTFLSISTKGNSVKSPCAAVECGNGLTLSYPFHPKQIHQPTFCGHPNLEISCINNQPILYISNNPYTVTDLNISAHSIAVSYAANESCPIVTHALGLDSDSPLNYSNAGNRIVSFYYNCTAYPASAAAAGIKCLPAFPEGSEPGSDWIRYCESNVTVPVMDGFGINGSGNSMRLGFALTWESVDRSCQVCEESGGFCGYTSRKFCCFCRDGRNSSLSCHVSGEVSKTSRLNYVAVGTVVVFGGTVALTIAIFYVNNKFWKIKYCYLITTLVSHLKITTVLYFCCVLIS